MVTPLAGRPEPQRREPLWDRVDRNRLRLVAYLAVFAVVAAVFLALIVAVFALLVRFLAGETGVLAKAAGWMLADGVWRPGATGILIAVLYEVWALRRSEKWIVGRLNAEFVVKGTMLEAKMVLKDMAIAAGLPVAPALYLLHTSNVNAFAFATAGRRPIVGVTEGFAARLTLDEQRAVFANLVARLASGDTMVSSAVVALLTPLQKYRSHRVRMLDEEDRLIRDVLEERRFDPNARTEVAVPVSAAFLPVLFPLILAGEVLAAAQRRSQLVAAEKADAEGMLLLKDPASMLSALERCVRLNNNVIEADQSLGDVFYCWTGDSTDDEDDPEWRRVARLREVLGVEGWVPTDMPATAGVDIVPPRAPRVGSGWEGRGE
ncbi:MAG: hypothetical protein U1E26_12610 [Coriobacteriia bacterium]|nr:hypothetical protein [Coriobacteriia bacterium]